VHSFFSGVPPRTLLGELTALPRPLAGLMDLLLRGRERGEERKSKEEGKGTRKGKRRENGE